MNLLIDTRDSSKVFARLNVNGHLFESYSESATNRPESILNLIEDVCTKAGKAIQEVDEITVEEGPGSYTGLKVGASVANALSFSLNKKVNSKKIGELVEPVYE